MQLRILWVGAPITPKIPDDFSAEIIHAATAEEALSRLEDSPRIDVVLAADCHNQLILARCKSHSIPYIAGSSELTDKTKLALLTEGATECVTFPASPEAVHGTLLKARTHARIQSELVCHRRMALDPEEEFVGRSSVIREILRQKDTHALAQKSLLITGETGTGKRAFAREIHRGSAHVPFLTAGNLNGPANLLQEDLFDGGINGPGLLTIAEGGTIVLPEITDMPLALQVRLAQLIQTRDVRVVCLSRRDPAESIKLNILSPDLPSTLTRIALPPLRQRESDIILLAEYFLRRAHDPHGRHEIGLDLSAREALLKYQWPGNVGELRYVITRAKSLYSNKLITSAMLSAGGSAGPDAAAEIAESVESAVSAPMPESNPNSGNVQLPPPPQDENIVTFRIGQPLQEVEREMLLRTLELTQGNRTKTANILGISVRTLFTKLQEIDQQKGSVSEKNPKSGS